MKINGVQLNLNYFDADDNRKHRKYLVQTSEKLVSIMDEPGDDADKLESICENIRTYFDKVFYKGSGIKVCGRRYDAKKHVEALEQVCNSIEAQMGEMADKVKVLQDLTPEV